VKIIKVLVKKEKKNEKGVELSLLMIAWMSIRLNFLGQVRDKNIHKEKKF